MRNPKSSAAAATAVAAATAFGFGPAAQATPRAVPAVPATSEVAVTQNVPSTLGTAGQFQVNLALLNATDVCAFDLYRSTESTGYQSYLGRYYGTTTHDLVSPSWGGTQYA